MEGVHQVDYQTGLAMRAHLTSRVWLCGDLVKILMEGVMGCLSTATDVRTEGASGSGSSSSGVQVAWIDGDLLILASILTGQTPVIGGDGSSGGGDIDRCGGNLAHHQPHPNTVATAVHQLCMARLAPVATLYNMPYKGADEQRDALSVLRGVTSLLLSHVSIFGSI